jgi:hypothetical protein
VILYTFLVGKPPYETKDVKSTYRRIRSNIYSFPENVKVSDHAKNLIGRILQLRPEARPTINEICQHPFFTHAGARIPTSLPASSLTTAPLFLEASHSKESHRRPLSDHNSNVQMQNHRMTVKPTTTYTRSANELENVAKNSQVPYKSTFGERENRENHKPALNVQRPSTARPSSKLGVADNVKDAHVAKPSGSTKAYGSSTGFAPYSSSSNARPSTATGVSSVPASSRATADVFSATGSDPFGAATSNDSKAVPKALSSNAGTLEMIHHQLVESFAAQKDGATATAVGAPTPVHANLAPQLWVTKWVDYTSKYGLGYLLNDGSSGVYFNDSSKIILAVNGDNFEYMERTSRRNGMRAPDPTRATHTLETYPTDLQKKVTLLKHFRNYLVDQQLKSNTADTPKPTAVAPNNNMVYLKKWVRTRHAILFRLSNRTVQVNFFDHTEIVLSSEARLVTYVDRHSKRTTFPLSDIVEFPRADIAKRLKYTKDILHQLISGGHR